MLALIAVLGGESALGAEPPDVQAQFAAFRTAFIARDPVADLSGDGAFTLDDLVEFRRRVVGDHRPDASVSGGAPVFVFQSPTDLMLPVGRLRTIDVLMDFTAEPTLGGGFNFVFGATDPSLFSASWTFGTSTVGDDPAFRRNPSCTTTAAGLDCEVTVGNFDGLTGPGVIGTLQLRATSGEAIGSGIPLAPTGADGINWVSLDTFQVQQPTYTGSTLEVIAGGVVPMPWGWSILLLGLLFAVGASRVPKRLAAVSAVLLVAGAVVPVERGWAQRAIEVSVDPQVNTGVPGDEIPVDVLLQIVDEEDLELRFGVFTVSWPDALEYVSDSAMATGEFLGALEVPELSIRVGTQEQDGNCAGIPGISPVRCVQFSFDEEESVDYAELVSRIATFSLRLRAPGASRISVTAPPSSWRQIGVEQPPTMPSMMPENFTPFTNFAEVIGVQRVVRLSPSSVRTAVGENVSLAVNVGENGESTTTGGPIAVRWDSNVLGFVDWQCAPSPVSCSDVSPSAGELLVTVELPVGGEVTGPLDVGELTLSALQEVTLAPVSLEPTAPWSPDDARYVGAVLTIGEDVAVSRLPTVSDAAMTGRCVVVFDLPDGDDEPLGPCPGVHNIWTGTKLFMDTQSPRLSQFCVYERPLGNMPSTTCADLEHYLEGGGVPGFTLSPAIMALRPQSTLKAGVKDVLWNQFARQAGKVTNYTYGESNQSTLKFVDTVDFNAEGIGALSEPASRHGPTIVNLTERLLSLSPGASLSPVAAGLSSAALPYRCFEEETCEPCSEGGLQGCPGLAPVGGFIGTLESLASAIEATVDQWEPQTEGPMVLNISVGGLLEPDPDGASVADLAGHQAVVAALEKAVCHDVLVVASAGNGTGGDVMSSGALFPGSLAAAPGISLEECNDDTRQHGADPDDFPDAQTRLPLLIAVSNVTADDQPLFNRRDGEAQFAAYGDHVAPGVAGGPYASDGVTEETQTGTSVSTAVVSAAAAVVRAYLPDAPAYEVLDILERSGRELDRAADFCFEGPPCPNVKRLFVCEAEYQACLERNLGETFCTSRCPDAGRQSQPMPIHKTQAPLQVSPGPGIASPVDLLLFGPFADVAEIDLSTYTLNTTNAIRPNRSQGADPFVGVCNPDGYYSLYTAGGAADGLPAFPCPQDEFVRDTTTSYLDPQPDGQVCEDCFGQSQSPGSVFVERLVANEDYPVLLDPTLLCRDPFKREVIAFRLPDAGTTNGKSFRYAPGERLRIVGIPGELCVGADWSLAFRVEKPSAPVGEYSSVIQPLLVVRKDTDDDEIPDFRDNCRDDFDPTQRDTNQDLFGSVCDMDLNDDCFTDRDDLDVFRSVFFTDDADADCDDSGLVEFVDLGCLRAEFLGDGPGYSALADLDGDGLAYCADPDDDNDGFLDEEDAFDDDPTEWRDTDGDAIGDNADPDDDNDGVADEDDEFPEDSNEWSDTDGDGIGDNADPDGDGDGFLNIDELREGSDPFDAQSIPIGWLLPILDMMSTPNERNPP